MYALSYGKSRKALVRSEGARRVKQAEKIRIVQKEILDSYSTQRVNLKKGQPTLVTDQQVTTALYFLKGEEELVSELLTMKIESDLYHKLLTQTQKVAWDETH